jgi:class 3 adenylate cyclase
MTTALDESNAERADGTELHLKIGLHRGPVIVVTLNNRLDYFGRTVNLASRVESLSGSRELSLTDDVLRAPGVIDALKARVARVTRRRVTLKGIDEPVTVFRVRIPVPELSRS